MEVAKSNTDKKPENHSDETTSNIQSENLKKNSENQLQNNNENNKNKGEGESSSNQNSQNQSSDNKPSENRTNVAVKMHPKKTSTENLNEATLKSNEELQNKDKDKDFKVNTELKSKESESEVGPEQPKTPSEADHPDARFLATKVDDHKTSANQAVST